MSNLISIAELNDCIKQWYEYMGVDTHGVWNKQLAEIVKGKDEDDLALDFRTLFARISALPSAEAVQGEWILRENGNKECSLCGHERQDGWDYFCGYCGARMKGGAE